MGGHGVYRGIRNHTSGSHSSRAYGHRPIVDQHLGRVGARRRSRTVAQLRARRSTRTARDSEARRRRRSRGTPPTRARARARARNRGTSSARKHQRDRERPRPRAEQRLVQIGIERRELLVGRLLRQLGVRPEPLERTVFRRIRVMGDDIVLQDCRAGRITSRISHAICNPHSAMADFRRRFPRSSSCGSGRRCARSKRVRRRRDGRRAARGRGRASARAIAGGDATLGDASAVVARIEAAAAAAARRARSGRRSSR